MATDPSLHLLAIDWTALPAGVSDGMRFRQEELTDLLRAACDGGETEMVILSTRQRFQVYVAGAPRAAMRAVLRSLLDRARGFTRLGQSRVIEASGVAAARELFRAATGLDSQLALGLRGLYAVTTAAALSAEIGVLGPHLAALCARANTVAWTAHHETELGAPLLPSERRELARYAVERIIEEQLLLWQASYTDALPGYPSWAPPESEPAFQTEYPAAEISSIVRIALPSGQRESVA